MCNCDIAFCNYMHLGEKMRYLRAVEGSIRGLGRPMTQAEVVAAMRKELKKTLSQSYLSQIESGARPHLTHTTRQLLARFFKVHPGFLVDDPEGFRTELSAELRALDAKLDSWLYGGADRFNADAALSRALFSIAQYDDSRKCLLLLEAILKMPGLLDRLSDVLLPASEKAEELYQPAP